jgi:hypothetical protein
MGLLKSKDEYVTRAEFEALAAQLESFKTIAAIAVAAIELAMKSPPGYPDANPRTRLEKLAAVAGLEPQECAELTSFFALMKRMDRAESRREFAKAQERTRPKRGEDYRPPSWRG